MTGPDTRFDVVHVVCTDAFAGVERYVATLAATQQGRGMSVAVLGGSTRRMPQELAGSGVRWAPASTPRAAVRSLATTRPGLVHAHMTAAELAATLGTRAPVVSTRHFAGRRGSRPWSRLGGRLIGARLSAQVAISDFVAGSVEGTSTVVHPGVPVVRDPAPATDRAPVVLMAQRLEAEKRTDLGLRIWAASGLAGQGWELQVAGSGACRDDLEKLAAGLGVQDSCRFLGARDDVDVLLRSAAVFLAPRPDEPYGLSVVEAMAHATPVVAGAGGGHDETVGSAPGAVMVPADDPARAGALLAGLARDTPRRAAYGTALRELQRDRFSLEAHADAIGAVYRSVLG